MKTKIKKWGNSLALRIPKPYAEEMALREDDEINIEVRDGRLVIEPVASKYSLKDLLARVNETNLHGEYESGPPRGREKW